MLFTTYTYTAEILFWYIVHIKEFKTIQEYIQYMYMTEHTQTKSLCQTKFFLELMKFVNQQDRGSQVAPQVS